MSALIESYSSANRVVDTDLAIKYSKTRVNGTWSYVSGTVITTKYSAWSYTRTATKSYRYVGMSKIAADACATDMRTKFNRSIYSSIWNPDGAGTEFTDEAAGKVHMADVAVQNVAGGMWEVVVNVSESDARLRMASTDTEQLFSVENARDYDTGA